MSRGTYGISRITRTQTATVVDEPSCERTTVVRNRRRVIRARVRTAETFTLRRPIIKISSASRARLFRIPNCGYTRMVTRHRPRIIINTTTDARVIRLNGEKNRP